MPVFRRATLQDASGVLELYHACCALPFCTWSEEYPSLESIHEDLDAQSLYVAEDETGAPLGAISCCVGELDDLKGVWSGENKTAVELARFCVKPVLHGQGLGGWLLDAMLRQMASQGFLWARLLVSEANQPAMRLYASRGFSPVGHTHLYERDWLCMERAIA